MKEVGIWLRVSTEDQVHGQSLEHHLKRAEGYANAKGWDIKQVYRLDAVSGKTVINHPETRRMLQDIKSGHISGIIFSKLARLARNTKELLEFSEIFREYNADLISLHESIDTSSPSGRLFFTIIAAMAQWEREEIVERVSASVQIRAKMGKSLGGAAPYGYTWVDQKLELNQEEAIVRKLMYELFLKFKRRRSVADELNNRGYRTRKGAKFSDTTITRLLKDPIAKGKRRINYTRSKGEGKHWEIKPKEEWIFVDSPSIISEEQWLLCNSILEKQQTKRVSRRSKQLFSGKAECECGEKMYVLHNSPKYTCTKCRNKIHKDDLEEIFHARLTQYLSSEVSI